MRKIKKKNRFVVALVDYVVVRHQGFVCVCVFVRAPSFFLSLSPGAGNIIKSYKANRLDERETCWPMKEKMMTFRDPERFCHGEKRKKKWSFAYSAVCDSPIIFYSAVIRSSTHGFSFQSASFFLSLSLFRSFNSLWDYRFTSHRLCRFFSYRNRPVVCACAASIPHVKNFVWRGQALCIRRQGGIGSSSKSYH